MLLIPHPTYLVTANQQVRMTSFSTSVHSIYKVEKNKDISMFVFS